MRIVPCILVLAFLMAGLNGCQLFGKKKDSEEGTPFLPAKSKNENKAQPAQSTDPLLGNGGSGPETEGILAGRVMDGAGRPADAQIRWICLDDPKESESNIDVAVDQQGYFMIQGLKNGKRYKLITRAKSGDKTLEVVTLTQVPNPKLYILVNDNFALPSAPDKSKSGSDKNKKSTGVPKEQPASAQFPVPGASWQQDPSTMLPPYADKTRIAEQGAIAIKPPTAEIKGGTGFGPPGQTPPQFTITPGAIPVPSSVRIGSRLENFALYDVSLQPWELKKDRRGKLVLLDFWKTNCPPCLQTIANLRVLQNQYGPAGLQVVGVTYEDSGTLPEQAHRIIAVAQQRQTNYQILIGGGAKCPLLRDLQVRNLPTLVLIDQDGAILWQHEGLLERAQVEDLEFTIKRRLN